MYAIIAAGGRQVRVVPSEVIELESGPLPAGEHFETEQVLLMERDGEVRVGRPFVQGAKVTGTVIGTAKGEKLRIFTYKAKKGVRRTRGHRAKRARVKIDEILG